MSTLNDLEAEDLELHVKICAERYSDLDDRLNTLDNKFDNMALKLEELRVDLVKTFLTATGTVIVAIIGAIAVILTKF